MFASLTRRAVHHAKPAFNMQMHNLRCFAIITRYTKSHEWIAYDTDTGLAKVGITDHA